MYMCKIFFGSFRRCYKSMIISIEIVYMNWRLLVVFVFFFCCPIELEWNINAIFLQRELWNSVALTGTYFELLCFSVMFCSFVCVSIPVVHYDDYDYRQ